MEETRMSFALAAIQRIGGGTVKTVRALHKGKKIWVTARIGLFGSDLGVITKGGFAGCVIVPRWDWTLLDALKAQRLLTVFKPEWRTYVMYDNLYDVARGVLQMSVRYGLNFQGGERAQLWHAQVILNELNLKALGIQDGNADILHKQFVRHSKTLATVAGKRPRLWRKKKIQNAASHFTSVMDSLGRLNPGAKAAVASGAREQVEHRLVEISHIERVLISRQKACQILIGVMDSHMRMMHDFLHLSQFTPDYAQSLAGDTLRPKKARKALSFFTGVLSTYDIKPFRTTAHYLIEEFERIDKMLSEEEFDQAVVTMRTSFNSIRLRHIRTTIESLLIDLVMLQLREIIPPPMVLAIRVEALKIADMLSTIQEEGFSHPVAQQSISHLQIAEMFLHSADVRALRQAKEALKQAAQCL